MEKFNEYDDDIEKTEYNIYDEIRHQQYGCNGDCYGAHGQVCPCIDTCPETRLKEGFATGVVIFVSALLGISVLILVIVLGVNWIIDLMR